MSIEIHNLQKLIEPDFELIERAVVESADSGEPDISVSLVDDAAIRALNADYLDRDRPTDVIAFDYTESDDTASPAGEVIVSAETAIRVAKAENRDVQAELLLYVVHGVLHLNGFDDQNPADSARMWEQQNRIMKALGFTDDFKP